MVATIPNQLQLCRVVFFLANHRTMALLEFRHLPQRPMMSTFYHWYHNLCSLYQLTMNPYCPQTPWHFPQIPTQLPKVPHRNLQIHIIITENFLATFVEPPS